MEKKPCQFMPLQNFMEAPAEDKTSYLRVSIQDGNDNSIQRRHNSHKESGIGRMETFPYIYIYFHMVKVESHLERGSEGPIDTRKGNISQVPYLFSNKNDSGERKK